MSTMEHLEKRIAALEQEVWAGSEPPHTHKESKPAKFNCAFNYAKNHVHARIARRSLSLN